MPTVEIEKAGGLHVPHRRERQQPGSDGSDQNDARRMIAQSYASGLPDPFGAGSSYSNTRGMKMLVWTNP